MSEQENVQRVQACYDTFARGDIPAFVETLADDVEWTLPGPTDVPILGTYHGKAGVQEWLGKMGENVQFQAFEPREFIAQGDKVVVLVHIEETFTRANREVTHDEAHVWTVRNGKIVRFVDYPDTAAVAGAYRGQ